MKLRVNMRVLKGMAIGLSVLMLLMAAALLLRNLDENQGRDTAPDVSSNAEGSSSSALEEAGDTRELTLPEVREVPIEAQPIPLEVCYEDADVIVVAYGASSRVARSAVNKAREAGKKVGLIRPITLWPFPKDAIKRAADHAKELLVVEMSMGQMVDDVRLAAECRVPVHFYGRTGGVIPTPKEILGEIDKLLK